MALWTRLGDEEWDAALGGPEEKLEVLHLSVDTEAGPPRRKAWPTWRGLSWRWRASIRRCG